MSSKMGRQNKFADHKKTNETPASELFGVILEDVIKTAEMSEAEWLKLSTVPFELLAIPVSQNGHYPVTQSGVDAAHKLTQQTWSAREDLRQTIARDAFNKLSFQAIGETICNMKSALAEFPENPDQPEAEIGDDAYAFLAEGYLKNLEKLAGLGRPDVDRHIPCHLFDASQAVQAFTVGPVQFRPRSDWLDLFVKKADERTLIQQVENGELEMETLRSMRTESDNGRHAANAVDVLTTLRHYSWVATIKMDGHEPVKSHQKASILVGLAIDVVGLRFHRQDALRFTKSGRQHLYFEDRLATAPDGRFLHGSSARIPGLAGKPGVLAAKMANEQNFLDAAGCILQRYLEGRRTGQALHLVERWVNALYWVGEARREASDFMAVVNYGCAADGLSGAGGDAHLMIAFAEAAFGPVDTPSPDGALSVSEAVHRVYREGRNKLAHGEAPGLLEDLAEPRATGEALLAILFDAVTPVLADLLQNEPNLLGLDKKLAYRLLQAKLIAKKASV
ncbi:hypothetical protein [Pseudomonas fluorescens]|uniref:hypothetical protein n=2 Tax=Pseudomonas TaxID=286 RepID=UPI001CA5B425|nr:hypothetical protein [Pseudomonas fluorescens]